MNPEEITFYYRKLQSCAFALSALVMFLTLPVAILLLRLKHGGSEAFMDTVEPDIPYQMLLPEEKLAKCSVRQTPARGLPKGNFSQIALKAEGWVPLPRRRLLVCFYEATVQNPYGVRLLPFDVCSHLIYGQFYMDAAGPQSKQVWELPLSAPSYMVSMPHRETSVAYLPA